MRGSLIINGPQIASISEAELLATSGGTWDWSDFANGIAYSFAIGCYVSVNPAICMGALATNGIAIYLN